jgi:PAS domain S-box-containing protein
MGTRSRYIRLLLITLSIAACTAFFESAYYSLRHASAWGLLPTEVQGTLNQPVLSIAVKSLEAAMALSILFLVVRQWVPAEEEHLDEERQRGERLEILVDQRTAELRAANDQLTKDIEERKEMSAALRANEAKLRRITDVMRDMVSETDVHGVIRYASPSHRLILGYDANGLVGHSLIEFIHPDDADKIRKAFERAVELRQARETEFRFRHADGHYLWLRSLGSVYLDDEGEVCGFVFGTHDITASKAAEEALRASEARNRAMIEAMPDLMFLLGRDGVFLDYHASDPKALYVPPEAFLGKTLHEVLPREVAGPYLAMMKEALETHTTKSLEYVLEMNGAPRHFEARAAPCGGAGC